MFCFISKALVKNYFTCNEHITKLRNLLWWWFFLKHICGHCNSNIDGAERTCRSLEDITFLGLPLAYLLDIKIVLSYDPAI